MSYIKICYTVLSCCNLKMSNRDISLNRTRGWMAVQSHVSVTSWQDKSFCAWAGERRCLGPWSDHEFFNRECSSHCYIYLRLLNLGESVPSWVKRTSLMPVLILQGGMCHVLIADLVPQIGEDSDKWLMGAGGGARRRQICCACHFLWCKYSHHGLFQTPSGACSGTQPEGHLV